MNNESEQLVNVTSREYTVLQKYWDKKYVYTIMTKIVTTKLLKVSPYIKWNKVIADRELTGDD